MLRKKVPDVKNLVTYSDACGNVTWQQIPEAGAVVAIGNHTLNVTVTDTSGNTYNKKQIFFFLSFLVPHVLFFSK